MTLQERMIAAYLRQVNLPPEEKIKLKLFLVLLDETYQEEPQSRAEQSRAEQSRAEQSRAPAPETPATTFSCGVTKDVGTTTPPAPLGATSPDKGRQEKPVDPLAEKAASEAPAETSLGNAPGASAEKKNEPDPLAEPLLKALEKEGLSLEEAAAEKHIGVRASVLQKVLDGEPIRKDSREKISRWVQGVGIAVTADI